MPTTSRANTHCEETVLRLLDLCSGIGGFSIAAHWAGWTTEAFCERDAFCQKVLAKNFPGIPIYDDVFTFPSESFRGRIDAISAGFPCQPFSAAGKREGRNDERHIFPKILEIVGTVRPTICVFENVRGLLSIESGRLYAEIISSLEGEGFEVATFCIPASALGAPHRRDRLWIIAHDAASIGFKRHTTSASFPNSDWSQDGLSQPTDRDAPDADASGLKGSAVSKRQFRQDEAAPNIDGRNLDAPNADDAGGRASRREANAKQSKVSGERQQSQLESSGHGEGPTDAQLRHGRLPGRAWGDEGRDWSENWLEVATRLCRMDDELPNGLDELTRVEAIELLASGEVSTAKKAIKAAIKRANIGSRDNRVDRLKALGNSIVPSIAYEIFRAINEANETHTTVST